MNCGPLSEIILSLTPGNISGALWMTISISASVIDSRINRQYIDAAIQYRAQIIESSTDIEIGNVKMPMRVRLKQLSESCKTSDTIRLIIQPS